MNKKKVLFVCIHNSARSQLAEEYLRLLGGDQYEVESAGLEPGNLNSMVVNVLKDDGIDISGKKTNAVADFLNANKQYDYVITVCDETSAERCPVFPGVSQKVHWSFSDPSRFEGSDEEKLAKVREVRDLIKAQITQWLKTSP